MAPPTINSLGENAASNVTSLDISVTVTDEVDDALLVGVILGEPSGSPATIQSVVIDPGGANEASFTLKDTHGGTAGITHRIEMWRLLNPPVGTFTVRITASENITRFHGEVSQAFPVDQTDPFATTTVKNNGSGTVASVTRTTSQDNSILIGVLSHESGEADLTPGTDVVELMDSSLSGSNGWVGYKEAPTAGSTTVDVTADTSDDWFMLGVELLAISTTEGLTERGTLRGTLRGVVRGV